MLFFFFFNDTATTEIYTLSLHDALPISRSSSTAAPPSRARSCSSSPPGRTRRGARSEEHTSELQSQSNLVCRLLLEKKKKYLILTTTPLTPSVSICAIVPRTICATTVWL